MQYDYKSLSLELTEVVLQRRIAGDEAAIAPGVPECFSGDGPQLSESFLARANWLLPPFIWGPVY